MNATFTTKANLNTARHTGLNLNRKSYFLAGMAVILVFVFAMSSASPASAQASKGTSDGKGCTWYPMSGHWFGYCYKPVTNSTGYIWFYYGGWKNPWLLSGHYDAKHEYIYNYQGGYLGRIEHGTKLMTFPTNCGWLVANQTCSPSAPVFTISAPTNIPINPIISSAVNSMINRWLEPTCTSSYNGC